MILLNQIINNSITVIIYSFNFILSIEYKYYRNSSVKRNSYSLGNWQLFSSNLIKEIGLRFLIFSIKVGFLSYMIKMRGKFD